MLSFLLNFVVTLGWGFFDIFMAKDLGNHYDKWADDASTKKPSTGFVAYWFIVFYTWNQIFILLGGFIAFKQD
jgi:hypothetical protein